MYQYLFKINLICISLYCGLYFFSMKSYSQEISQVPNTKTVQGQLWEKGRKIKLSGIQIYLLPEKKSTTTDKDGNFIFTEVIDHQVQLIINDSSFDRLEKTIDLQAQSSNLGHIYLQKIAADAGLQLDVEDSNLKRDQSKNSLSRKQILEMPGANGDPLKAVQNLPGINRTGGFSSQVVIQGSAPKDTSYDFEEHEIPLAFHFGGLNSIVMPEAVDSVDYYSAGYQSNYSRALGGIISLKTRNPEVEERDWKGLFYVDNLSAGGLFESKIDEKNSFLISGRYSYIGFFLRAVAKDNEDFDLTVAPEFMDLTGVYRRKISEDENLKISILASRDRMEFLLAEPVQGNSSVRGRFSNAVNFYRFIPQWTKKIDGKNTIKASVGLGKNQITLDIGDRYFNVDSTELTTRGEWEHQYDEKIAIQTGWDHLYSKSDVKFKLPTQSSSGGVSSPVADADDKIAEIKNAKVNNLGLYLQAVHRFPENFKFIPGIRFDRIGLTKENFLSPRLAAQYNLDEYRLLKTAYGQYVQSPEPQEVLEEYGNPDVKAPRADHYTLGYEHDFKRGAQTGSVLGLNTFYRTFKKIVIASSKLIYRNGTQTYEAYNNDGQGKAYGLEISYKYKQDVWSTTLAYTYSKSLRSDPKNGEYNFEYDQTHNFNLISAYEFKNNWKVSGRYRFVTGNPYTPITSGIYDADNESYYPVRGDIYSQRNKAFQQLDIRIDKKMIYDRSIWSFYLDIQNVLNTKNPEGILYSYDYSAKQEITGLPFLPALGVRGEF